VPARSDKPWDLPSFVPSHVRLELDFHPGLDPHPRNRAVHQSSLPRVIGSIVGISGDSYVARLTAVRRLLGRFPSPRSWRQSSRHSVGNARPPDLRCAFYRFGTNLREIEFTQCRVFLAVNRSPTKTWPRWPAQAAHSISTRLPSGSGTRRTAPSIS